MKTRILGDSPESDYYHVISRVVDRRFVLQEVEKEYFRKLLLRQAAFAGVRVVAWCLMSNHFHLLVEVPNKDRALQGMSDEECLERLQWIRSERHTRMLLGQVEMWQHNGNKDGVAKVAAGVRDRLFDLSVFVKELKNKFSFWFNKQHGRKGTLWEERFKSVLLEDGEAVRFCAAYIDLNPVRGGLCKDPEAYRWCSYGAAVAGNVDSRRGLARAWGRQRWTGAVAREHRLLLFGRGEKVSGGESAWGESVKAKGGFSRERIEAERKRGGRLAPWQLLRCRVRYFTAGAVLGSRGFVDGVFERERSRFGPKRQSGARKMQGGQLGAVMSLRDLNPTSVQRI